MPSPLAERLKSVMYRKVEKYDSASAFKDAWQVARYKVGSGAFASHFGHLMPGEFKEELHPRGGKGTEKGGQFVSKGQGGARGTPAPRKGDGRNVERPGTTADPTPEQIAERPDPEIGKVHRAVKIGKTAYHLQKRQNGWYAQVGGKGSWRRVAEQDQERVGVKIQGENNKAKIIDLLYSGDRIGTRLEKESGLDKDTFISVVIGLMKEGRISQNRKTGRLSLGDKQRQISFKERRRARQTKPGYASEANKPPIEPKPFKPFEPTNRITRTKEERFTQADFLRPAHPQPIIHKVERTPEQEAAAEAQRKAFQEAWTARKKAGTQDLRKARKEENEARLQTIAQEYEVDPNFVRTEAEDIFKVKNEEFRAREAAKDDARRETGMTAADIRRLENQHKDHTSLRHWDDIAHNFARAHPGVIGDPDDAGADFGAELWNLIKEGEVNWTASSARRPPTPFDADILKEAAIRVKSGQEEQGASFPWEQGEEAEMVPFRYPGMPYRFEMTEMIRDCYAKFREEDHPRGQPENAGEFVEKKQKQKKLIPQLSNISKTTTTENGVHFETGIPVTFGTLHNNEKSPKAGPDDPFQQKIEPAGYYITHLPKEQRWEKAPATWQYGEITFNNPLVIKNTLDENILYGPSSWKVRLSQAYGGKKGHSLSEAIRNDGYDGIVNVDAKGNTTEIVSLVRGFKFNINPPKKLYRGVMHNGVGAGTFSLGKGLYSTPRKSYLSGLKFDKIIELTPEQAFPTNPLVIRNTSEFPDWLLKTSGMKNMVEFNKKYADPGEFVKQQGFNGVYAGDEIVKYF